MRPYLTCAVLLILVNSSSCVLRSKVAGFVIAQRPVEEGTGQ